MFSLFGRRAACPEDYQAPRGIPSPDEARRLVLYKYDSCPYCMRVFSALRRLGIDVELRDTLTEPTSRQELAQATGRTQVPALFVDDVPLLESADIVAWLEAYAVRGHVA